MSLRPRLGGTGTLVPAGSVEIYASGGPDAPAWLVGDYAQARAYDPFERLEGSELLLAEEFARADLARPEDAAAWYTRRGALDLRALFPAEPWTRLPPDVGFPDIFDAHEDLLRQQVNVRWHIETIARLSLPDRPYEPSWAELAVLGPGSKRWVSAAEDGAPLEVGLQPAPRPDGPSGTRPPSLWVPRSTWFAEWDTYQQAAREGRFPRPLTSDWDGLVELARRLLDPWVRRAALAETCLGYKARGAGPIELGQQLSWTSILGPVYLQLAEGLRRATEGRPGAIYCRECGQPFLSLDARRFGFCTDRERGRHTQRAFRTRIADSGHATEAITIVKRDNDGNVIETFKDPE